MAIALNIPSQIKKYLSVAFFPATGNEFTLYIANDTNRLYQWNGAAYIEVSQQDAVNWGSIGGNIINQTDLQLALAGKVDVEAGKGLSTNDYTTAEKNKLAGIEAGAQVNDVDSVNGYTGAVVLSKSDVGLSNVDNTSDLNKPISTATQNALNAKENTITAGTTSQYFRGDKTFQTLDKVAVGLGNVDNTSDANKPISTATQTALNAKQNTLSLTTTGDNGASTLVGSTLNVPNYTLSGLGGVPTSRTLTINGVTQDLSANRTFTISTGITIGSTAIASGVVGRVLFEGAGNVVQESANLFWDNTNGRLGVGTSSPTQTLDIVGSLNSTSSLNGDLDNLIIRNTLNGAASQTRLRFYNELTPSTTTGGAIFYTSNAYSGFPSNSFGFWNYNANGVIALATNNTERFRIFATGNVSINTTTDAGFRLDVNGTARFKDTGSNSSIVMNYATGGYIAINNASASETIRLRAGGGASWFNTGQNLLIGTTTDAGFRLDVNGTARFQSDVTVANSLMKMYVTGGVIRFEQQGGAGIPIAFMQNGSFYQYIDQATLNIAFRNDYSFVMTTGNTSTINASAKMQIDSTTRGFLPPRMTTTQKNAIASPAAGLMVYDTTLNVISYYNGTMWI